MSDYRADEDNVEWGEDENGTWWYRDLELLNGMNGRIERNLNNGRDEWSKRGLM